MTRRVRLRLTLERDAVVVWREQALAFVVENTGRGYWGGRGVDVVDDAEA